MKTNSTLKTVEIDGKQAVLFVPELVDNLAIVDLVVLKRLAQLLPTANINEIKDEMIAAIRSTKTLADYVVLLRDEVSFHESVNLITLYKQSTSADLREWPAKD